MKEMQALQILWKKGEKYEMDRKYFVHPQSRYRIICHCGQGLCVDVPGRYHKEFSCSCGIKFTVNFHGDVFCHKCQEAFNKDRVQ